MKRLSFYMLFVMTAMLSVVSCGNDYAYDHYRSVNVTGWNRGDTLDFNVGKIPSGTYEMNVGFRATTEYPFKELGIDVSYVTSASAKIVHKRVKCGIFDNEGRMLGRSGVSTNDFIYRVGTLKVNPGDSVVISVAHAMNQEVMPGLTQVGVQLMPFR